MDQISLKIICYNWLRQSIMEKEYEGKKERQRKRKKQMKAFATVMRTLLKQPERNAQRDPGEKGWACYYCGKGGAPQVGLPSGI